LGSTAAVVIEPLMARLEQSQWSPTRGSWERFEAPGADQLAAIGPAAVPALCKGLTGNSDAVQAGSARALGQMDAVEARSAIPDLLKLFDESKNEKVQIVALGALIQLAADPKELAPRLHPLVGAGEAGTPIAAPRNEPRHGSLAAIATRYLRERNSQKPPAPQRGMLRHRYPFDPADFSWGQTSAGLQVGVSLPPIIYGSQKNEPDVRRLLVAIRNVGDRPVVLPLDASHPAGLDVRLTEEPDVLSPHASGFHSSPDLHELRPGQVILTRPAITLRLAYGRRTAAGRWTPFVGKDKDYHVTVTLRGLNNPDPPHLPCYASAAVRKECWQGVAASGTIATRLDNTYVQY
jgi:hypothetical protein